MQKKSAAWIDGAPVRVYAELDDRTWPSGDATLPGGFVDAGSWQVQRDLTGGGLPGAARGGSGFSVATGSASVPQLPGAVLSPFGDRRVRAGGGCKLWAFGTGRPPALKTATLTDAEAIPIWANPLGEKRVIDTTGALPLGVFTGRELNGSAGSPEISISLSESADQLSVPFVADLGVSAVEPKMDASVAIARAAELSGLNPTRRAYAFRDSTYVQGGDFFVQSPLIGSARATYGALESASSPRWANFDGRQYYVGGALRYAVTQRESFYEFSRNTVWLSCIANVAGAGIVVESAGARITITPTSVTGYAYGATATASLPASGFIAGAVSARLIVRPGEPLSITVEFSLSGVARSLTAYSATNPTFTSAVPSAWVRVTPSAGGGVYDFAACTDPGVSPPDLDAFLPANTLIEYANSPITGLFDLAGKSCWDVIQETAKSTMGAAWLNEAGQLVYRGRESLRAGTPTERILADEQLEDVPWTISEDNAADRVEVKYQPANIAEDRLGRLTAWEATEPVRVGGQATVALTVDIVGSSIGNVAPFTAVWANASDPLGLQGSTWAAAPQRDGSGTRPSDTAIQISSKLISPSRVSLRIQNTTMSPLWLVDGNGTPTIIMRTSLQVQAGEVETVDWGAPEEKARAPFVFEAGQFVQDATTAGEMLTWLVSQVQTAQPTMDQVRVKPDLARQLGDIVVLTEEKRTVEHVPLKTKALITGLGLSGSAGSIEQTLNLALLADTFRDFDVYCQAKSINNFSELDAHLASLNINTFDELDRWASTEFVDY